MEKQSRYFYPDVSDEVTIKLIEEKEPFPGYWGKSEEGVLAIFERYIKDYLTVVSAKTTFLDAGTGEGRLLPMFSRYFDRLLAIEPDEQRLAVARKRMEETALSGKVSFLQGAFEEIELGKEEFDVLLASHIVQHIPTETVDSFFRKAYALLKPTGLFLLTTSHARRGSDLYVKDYLKEGKVQEENISEAEFNALIRNERGILPIHFYTFDSLESGLTAAGFEVLEFGVFHELSKTYPLDRVLDRDLVINSLSFFKNRFGRDLYMVCRK